MKRRCAALAVLAAAAGCSCDPIAANGTALRVRVNLDEQLSVTQLRFSATHEGSELFTPVVRPDPAGDRLMSGGSLLALLPDALDGKLVECRVEGLESGTMVSSASQSATVKRGVEVPCTVFLMPRRACNEMSCAGCCTGDTCLAGGSAAACGSGGEACRPCAQGQRCASGACLCDPASCSGCCSGTDCLDGGVPEACGTGGNTCAACGAGQRCAAGGCICDAASCGGCCRGVTCVDGGADLACGSGGNICSTCPAPQTCTGGVCGCDGGACGAGCTAASCTSGCCSAGTCVANAPDSCGTGGVACFDCRTAVSDRCGPGNGCGCGNQPGPCPSTLHCVSGACVCDETVCSGCCEGVNCLPGDKKQNCGSDGGACRNCTGGTCVANRCQ